MSGTVQKHNAPAPEVAGTGVDLRALAPWGLLFLLTALLHGAGLWVPFVWDDLQLVQGNPSLREPWRLLVAPLFPDAGAGNYYRPLPFLLYAVAGELAGFASAVPFQLMQLLAVLVVAGLVFHVARRFFDLFAAWLIAALVVVFPATVEAAAWLSALPDVVVFGFTLVFLLRYWQEQEADTPSKVFLLIFAAALLSKESGVALLPLLLMLDWSQLRRFGLRRRVRFYAPFVGVLVVFVIVRSLIVPVSPEFQPGILLPLKTMGAYLWKLVNPWPLAILLEDRTAVFDGRVILGALAAVTMAGCVLFSASQRVRLGCALLLAGMLPYLNLWRPFGEPYLIAERYMLPMVFGAAILVATAATRLPRRAGYGILAALIIVYLPSGFTRYQEWQAPAALWAAQIEAHPEKVRPYLHLARIHHDNHDMPQAVEALEAGLARWDAYQSQYSLRIDNAFLYGLHEAAWRVYAGAGQFDDSLDHARKAYAAHAHPEPLRAGIRLHDRLLDFEEALASAVRGVGVYPRDPELVAMATGYAVLGDRPAALRTLAEQSPLPVQDYAAQLQSEFADLDALPLYDRGLRIYQELDVLSLAFRAFDDAASDLTAEQAANVARIAFEEQLYDQSISYYRRALRSAPRIDWERRLGVALIASGQTAEGCRILLDASGDGSPDESWQHWFARCPHKP